MAPCLFNLRTLSLCCFLALGNRLLAVDPLPPEIEQASLTVQAEYLERVGHESERQRQEVAARRFEQRQKYRTTISTEMAREVDLRHQAMFVQAPGATLAVQEAVGGPSPAETQSQWGLLAFLGLTALFAFQFRKRLFGGETR
jgi:hypothetical protein